MVCLLAPSESICITLAHREAHFCSGDHSEQTSEGIGKKQMCTLATFLLLAITASTPIHSSTPTLHFNFTSRSATGRTRCDTSCFTICTSVQSANMVPSRSEYCAKRTCVNPRARSSSTTMRYGREYVTRTARGNTPTPNPNMPLSDASAATTHSFCAAGTFPVLNQLVGNACICVGNVSVYAVSFLVIQCVLVPI